MKRKRKCTITITGDDESKNARVELLFDPPVNDEDNKSGFTNLVNQLLDAMGNVKCKSAVGSIITPSGKELKPRKVNPKKQRSEQ